MDVYRRRGPLRVIAIALSSRVVGFGPLIFATRLVGECGVTPPYDGYPADFNSS